jgi:hypothetical protein
MKLIRLSVYIALLSALTINPTRASLDSYQSAVASMHLAEQSVWIKLMGNMPYPRADSFR